MGEPSPRLSSGFPAIQDWFINRKTTALRSWLLNKWTVASFVRVNLFHARHVWVQTPSKKVRNGTPKERLPSGIRGLCQRTQQTCFYVFDSRKFSHATLAWDMQQCPRCWIHKTKCFLCEAGLQECQFAFVAPKKLSVFNMPNYVCTVRTMPNKLLVCTMSNTYVLSAGILFSVLAVVGVFSESNPYSQTGMLMFVEE